MVVTWIVALVAGARRCGSCGSQPRVPRGTEPAPRRPMVTLETLVTLFFHPSRARERNPNITDGQLQEADEWRSESPESSESPELVFASANEEVMTWTE